MKLKDLVFELETVGESYEEEVDYLWSCKVEDVGRITVLDRMTGFGYRDVETGYKDTEGKFWLASGHKDVRNLNPDVSIEYCIDWIKREANTCVGE